VYSTLKPATKSEEGTEARDDLYNPPPLCAPGWPNHLVLLLLLCVIPWQAWAASSPRLIGYDVTAPVALLVLPPRALTDAPAPWISTCFAYVFLFWGASLAAPSTLSIDGKEGSKSNGILGKMTRALIDHRSASLGCLPS